MSPNPLACGRVRPAAVVNAEIRSLAKTAWGRPFTDEERAAYRRLVAEWTAAVRRPVAVAEAA